MSYALDVTAAVEVEATAAAAAPVEAAAPWSNVPTVADAGPLDTVEIQDEDKELLDRLAAGGIAVDPAPGRAPAAQAGDDHQADEAKDGQAGEKLDQREAVLPSGRPCLHGQTGGASRRLLRVTRGGPPLASRTETATQ